MTKDFKAIYLPIGVPTFHQESIQQQFDLSVELLHEIASDILIPRAPLLTLESLNDFIEDQTCDLLIVQNISFANSEYIAEILRRIEADVLLWTLQEPVIDGGRLRLNSLTGAYSAGNFMFNSGHTHFEYIFGAVHDEQTISKIKAVIAASRLKKELRSLTLASIGHTPEGFGFGRSLDVEITRHLGMKHITIEARELMSRARRISDDEMRDSRREAENKMVGLDDIPRQNVDDFARLYKVYADFIEDNQVAAISSRCWPDYFVEYGTPVCAVLGMLNDKLIASACEADDYGAISMLIGMKLSQKPVFFGDPVSLDKEENTITYWHCGTGACSLAHPRSMKTAGIHPNRKIGPTMEFGVKPAKEATVFRLGRMPDGTIRFFIAKGEILDKEQQFLGTSLVFKSDSSAEELVNQSIRDGWEPHFAVVYQDIRDELVALAQFLKIEVWEY